MVILAAICFSFIIGSFAPNVALAQDDPTETEVLLESVGTLAASNMYLSYLSITMTWQAIETLDREQQVDDLLSPVESSLNIVRTNLAKVLKTSVLTPDDKSLILDIDTACTLMKSAIADLKEYARTKSAEHKRIFADRHTQIGESLDKIFGTSKEKKEDPDDE